MSNALDNVEIENFFKSPLTGKHSKFFGGVFLQDQLDDLVPQTGKFYVVNFLRTKDPVGEMGHWTLCWNVRDGSIIYIDSFGQPAPEAVNNFMKLARRKDGRRKEIIYSTTNLQNINSDYCGYFVLFIAKEMLRGKSLLSVLSRMDLLESKLNDYFVKRLIKDKYFKGLNK